MAGKNRKRNEKKQSNTWLIGAAAIIFVALLVGWFVIRASSNTEVKNVRNTAEIAVIDTEKALQAHSLYEKLKELRISRDTMNAELNALKLNTLKLLPPDAKKRPFDEATAQKIRQKQITTHGEMMEELKAAEKRKRNELAPVWEAERKETNDIYLNEILNLRLKLDNADMMRLSKETRAAMIERMQFLQQERGQKQLEVNRKYEGMICDYLADLAAQKGIARDEVLALFSEDIRTYELRRRSAAQKRNVEEIQKKLVESMKSQQRMITLRTALAAKETEINVLEGKMLNDIAGKASKLAVVHHLTTIFAAPSMESTAAEKGRSFPAVININVKDLTKELINELRQSQ